MSKRVITFLFVLAAMAAQIPGRVQGQNLRAGVIAPLSGNLADCGQAIRNGIELARSDQPERFRKIRFIFEDSQYQGARAVAAAKKLKTVDKIDLIYVFGHGDAHSVAPVAESLSLPMVACTVEKDIAAGRKFLIRFFVPPELIGTRLAEFVRARGFKRIAVVKTDTSFLETIFDGLNRALDPSVASTVVGEIPWGEMDFRTPIAKIKGSKFDAIAVFLGQGQISRFYRQAAEFSLTLPSFGTHAFESSNEITDAAGTMEGAVYAGINAADDFRARYLKRYGDDRQVSFAANAYDFAMLAGELMSEGDTVPVAEEILRRFKRVKDYHGVTGTASYVETEETGAGYIFPVELKRIKGVSFEVLP